MFNKNQVQLYCSLMENTIRTWNNDLHIRKDELQVGKSGDDGNTYDHGKMEQLAKCVAELEKIVDYVHEHIPREPKRNPNKSNKLKINWFGEMKRKRDIIVGKRVPISAFSRWWRQYNGNCVKVQAAMDNYIERQNEYSITPGDLEHLW